MAKNRHPLEFFEVAFLVLAATITITVIIPNVQTLQLRAKEGQVADAMRDFRRAVFTYHHLHKTFPRSVEQVIAYLPEGKVQRNPFTGKAMEYNNLYGDGNIIFTSTDSTFLIRGEGKARFLDLEYSESN